MKYLRGYLKAWISLLAGLSPLWIVFALFYGLLCIPNLYLVGLISLAAVGGIIKVGMEK